MVSVILLGSFDVNGPKCFFQKVFLLAYFDLFCKDLAAWRHITSDKTEQTFHQAMIKIRCCSVTSVTAFVFVSSITLIEQNGNVRLMSSEFELEAYKKFKE